MPKIVRVNATLYKELLDRIEAYASKHLEDRSTAIRQLLVKGLQAELKSDVIKDYRDGRLTLREAAEILGVSYWEIQDILRAAGVPIQNLSDAEIEERISSEKEYARNQNR